MRRVIQTPVAGDERGLVSGSGDEHDRPVTADTGRREGPSEESGHVGSTLTASCDALLHDIASTTNQVIWIWDAHSGAMRYVSRSYASVWQRPDEPAPQTIAALSETIHPVDRGRVRQSHQRSLETGGSVECYRITTREGSVRWIHERASVMRDADGRPLLVIGIAEDITERRQLEEQLRQAQKMESMGQLASGVAHDFNNWLTVIIGYVELLGNALPAESPSAKYVAEIRRASERASGLTRQLLAFSRKERIDPQVVNFNSLVADTQRMLRRLLGDDIILESRLAPGVGRVKVDPTQWVQVLTNLAVNARDAMPTGGRLTITTDAVTADASRLARHPGAAPGRFVCLSVADSGCGMTRDVVDRVFEPFFTTKPAGKGTGLGLTLVYGVVDGAGGFVEVESDAGRGTTFSLYIPEVQDPAEATVTQTTPQSGGGESILVVDDEPSLRDVACFTLRGYGYRVFQASDGVEALRVLDDHGPEIDILFTDVVMPGKGGREIVEAVTSSWPHIRVIYTSGYTDDAMVRYGIAHNEFAFLPKPYTPKGLLSTIHRVLQSAGGAT